ncbi:COG4581: Superfamily II RNA helicase [Richelia intracellularis HM01]|nr:COG4581: Superfamily II RNA helicase [Richelia intracellularis HM01]
MGRDNRWYVTTTTDVVGLHAEIPRIEIPEDLLPPPEMPLKPGQCRRGNQQAAIIARKIPAVDSSFYTPPEIIEQLQRVNDTQEQLQTHHLFKTGSVALFSVAKQEQKNCNQKLKPYKSK